METTEFLERFNVLYNNTASNAAPGLNTYEVSVFLTKGQSEIMKNYFNPLGNKYREGFDGSPKRQIDFSRVIKTVQCKKSVDNTNIIDLRSQVFELPNDVMFILNENLYTVNNSIIEAIPISFADYSSLMRKPFKYPHKSEAWRLLSEVQDNKTQIEIISNEDIDKYIMRYVRKVNPIIVDDLTQYNTSINGFTDITQCELDEELHEEILQRAVELAKSTYIGDLNTTLQVGQRSE